jgi:hypothetical protein
MSSATDPENLPPRRAREDADGNGSYRPAPAGDDSTRTFDQVPATDAGTTSTYEQVPAARNERATAAYAERDYVHRGCGAGR